MARLCKINGASSAMVSLEISQPVIVAVAGMLKSYRKDTRLLLEKPSVSVAEAQPAIAALAASGVVQSVSPPLSLITCGRLLSCERVAMCPPLPPCRKRVNLCRELVSKLVYLVGYLCYYVVHLV